MEMYVIITLVAIGIFILADVFRLHRKAQKELARQNFGTLAKRKRTLKDGIMKEEKNKSFAILLRKPNVIRVKGAKPISRLVMTPREYGEYLLRKGVKQWGRNK